MLTEHERRAKEIARRDFGVNWTALSCAEQDDCLRMATFEWDYCVGVAKDELEPFRKQCEKDKEDAKTWGGDIDLVSF